MYISYYDSPLGKVLISADDIGVTGLWFCNQKHFAAGISGEPCERMTDAIADAIRWLDAYFSGNEPDFIPALNLSGTDFQKAVWAELLKIPYGSTVTYGELAKRLAQSLNRSAMSARAVGGAVGRNKISVIIPCHRLVGADGRLTGYAGGLERKARLLELERA